MTVDTTTDGNDPGVVTGLVINTAGTGYENGDRFTIDGYPGAAAFSLTMH